MAVVPNFDFEILKRYATLNYYLSKGTSGNVYGPIKWNAMTLAIKEVMFADGKYTDAFKKEIEAKRKIWDLLEHKHLLKTHSVNLSQLPKVMFIVMDFAAGGSLNKTLRLLGPGYKLPIDVVTNWAKQIAEGMLYLHEKDIVHRDLKSSNILLMEPFDIHNSQTKMTLKITDFDEVKEQNDTATMSFVGTFAYMAPEVLLNQRFSKASDVWSYGVVVWEMVSGDVPHENLQPGTLIYKSINQELGNLPMQGLFPEDCKQLLKSCWDPSSKKRPSFHDISCVLQCMAYTENFTVVNNHQFLLDNINTIEQLHKKNCITDEERDKVNKQPVGVCRNDELLQWMRTFPFKQTDQNFLAKDLVNGGVFIKTEISTKMTKAGFFTKSSSKNVEKLKAKEAILIERLNENAQGLQLPSIQNATSEIMDEGIVIAPFCRQQENGIVVWFWCQSINGQRNFESMYKSGILLENLITIFKKCSQNSASYTSTWLSPTSITTDLLTGDFNMHGNELLQKSQSDPGSIQAIRTKAAKWGGTKSNFGLSNLEKQNLVEEADSQEVEDHAFTGLISRRLSSHSFIRLKDNKSKNNLDDRSDIS